MTPIATSMAEINTDWKLYDKIGVAPGDVAASGASVAVHLAGAKGVYGLGPMFAIDRDASK